MVFPQCDFFDDQTGKKCVEFFIAYVVLQRISYSNSCLDRMIVTATMVREVET